jgi:hypothetical protein
LGDAHSSLLNTAKYNSPFKRVVAIALPESSFSAAFRRGGLPKALQYKLSYIKMLAEIIGLPERSYQPVERVGNPAMRDSAHDLGAIFLCPPLTSISPERSRGAMSPLGETHVLPDSAVGGIS